MHDIWVGIGLVGLGAVRFNERGLQPWISNLVTIFEPFAPRKGSLRLL